MGKKMKNAKSYSERKEPIWQNSRREKKGRKRNGPISGGMGKERSQTKGGGDPQKEA